MARRNHPTTQDRAVSSVSSLLSSPLTDSDAESIDSMLRVRALPPAIAHTSNPRENDPSFTRHSRPGPAAEQMSLPHEEMARAHADLYGRPPPEMERVAALEVEIIKIPPESCRALRKAMRLSPLLFLSSPHAKMMLREDPFDPADAARRLARYWEVREGMFGFQAFTDGVFSEPTFDDYLRYYDKCERVLLEASREGGDVQEELRRMAAEYVQCVNQTKIKSMDKIVESAPLKDRAAFLEAQRALPEVASSDEHKLLFLRCEDFVEARAARRMLRYWAVRRLFFGPEIANRKITLGDVSSHIFELGLQDTFRIIPGTDGHGRVIMACFMCNLTKEGWTQIGLARYVWYLMEALLEQEECRSNGIVFLVDYRQSSRDFLQTIIPFRQIGRKIFLECAPIKIKAMHVCFHSDMWWQQCFAIAYAQVSAIVKSRAVVHVGTDEENAALLGKKYGIGAELVPTELGGEAEREGWNVWIEQRRTQGM